MTSTTKKKYVTKEVLEDFSFPKENQSILKVIRSRGNNLHEVVTSTGEEFLASMPPKFRNHIWIKRGDFVVTEAIPEGHKVKAEIVRILLKEQIKYFKENNVWPEAFGDKPNKDSKADAIMPKTSNDEEDDDDNILICNPNKPVIYYVSEDSSSEDDEDDIGRDFDEGSNDDVSDGDDINEGDAITDGESDSSEDEFDSDLGSKLTTSVTTKCKHLCI